MQTPTPDVEWEDIGPDTLFHPRSEAAESWFRASLADGLNHFGSYVEFDSARESGGVMHCDILIDLMAGAGLVVAPLTSTVSP